MDNNENYEAIKQVISEIEKKYNEEDTASSISNLIDELNIKLSAYQFDKEYEKDK